MGNAAGLKARRKAALPQKPHKEGGGWRNDKL